MLNPTNAKRLRLTLFAEHIRYSLSSGNLKFWPSELYSVTDEYMLSVGTCSLVDRTTTGNLQQINKVAKRGRLTKYRAKEFQYDMTQRALSKLR